MTRPKLYPGHRHQWGTPGLLNNNLVRCTVCGFEVPRSAAKLDGAMLNDAVYDEPDTDRLDFYSGLNPRESAPDTDRGGAT